MWSPTTSPPRRSGCQSRCAARADVAVAGVAGGGRQVAPDRLGQRLRQAQRGARRRVLLGAVMRLDDLDVVVVTERARRVGDQLQHHVDADRIVGGVDDRDPLRRDVQRRARMCAQPRRADDQPDPVRRRRRRRDRLGHVRGGEVDPDVGDAACGQLPVISTPARSMPATTPASLPTETCPGRSDAAARTARGVAPARRGRARAPSARRRPGRRCEPA